MYVNHNGYGGRSYPYCSPSSGHDLRGRFLFLQQQQPLLRPGSVVEIGSVRSYCYYSDQPNPLHSNSNYSNPVFFSLDRHVPKPKPKGAAAMRLKAHQSAVVGPDRPAGEADHQLLGPAEGGGGGERRKNSKMVLVELVGAFNEVTQRMLMTNNVHVLSTSSSRLLFQTLKLSIPLLLPLHYHHHHHGLHQPRSSLSKALSVALILADLQMDAEVISAAILREAVEAGAIALKDVGRQIGAPTAHLLHESLRVKSICAKPRVLDALDLGDQSAAAFRKYCLAYYDVRAVILDLAVRLDTMRHDLHHLPRYQQQIFSLQVIRIHAPLAHAVGFGANFLSPELEDMSFRYLFPFSYLYIDSWLSRNHRTAQIDVYRDELLGSLNADLLLSQMVDNISVEGRYKTRYSTMKKLLTDGRRPEQVNDILGLRVILRPTTSGGDEAGLLGERACYRTRKIIQSMWKEIPHRAKDYISRPKANGYKSLHLAVDVSDNGSTVPLMEIQIRTTEMDMLAAGGTASHSLYKGGLTDPEEAKRSKAIMIAAADFAALRLKDVPSSGHKTNHIDPVFSLIDKNDDGKISIEELTEVMEELGGRGEDAREMMQLFDSNSDGSLSSDEFHLFQKQVGMIRNLEGRDDDPFRTLSNEKLQRTESGGLIQVHREGKAFSQLALETRIGGGDCSVGLVS